MTDHKHSKSAWEQRNTLTMKTHTYTHKALNKNITLAEMNTYAD